MWNNYAMIPTNAPQQVAVAPDVTDASYHDNLGVFETEPLVNGLFRFTTFLAKLRQRHESLQQKYYGDLVPDDQDVSYLFYTPSMEGDLQDGDRALSVYINSPGDNFLMMVNMADAEVGFTAPTPADGRVWRRLVTRESGRSPPATSGRRAPGSSWRVWCRCSHGLWSCGMTPWPRRSPAAAGRLRRKRAAHALVGSRSWLANQCVATYRDVGWTVYFLGRPVFDPESG